MKAQNLKGRPGWFGAVLLAWGMFDGASLSQAQAFHPQVTKLHAKVSAPPEATYFGQAVAASDRYHAVGEPRSDEAANEAGAAHLFDEVTGRHLRRLRAADADTGDAFGASVAVSGNWVVVGAPQEDEKGTSAGAAYVFDASTGRQIVKLLDPDGAANDQFGHAVAVSGNLCVVGVPEDDDFIHGTSSGSALVFELPSGALRHKLKANDGEMDDLFGYDVAIRGNLVVAGSPWDANAKGNNAGAIYVFDAESGAQALKILAPDGAEDDLFGNNVALDGHRVIGAAPGDDDKGSNSGSAYVFDVRTGAQLSKLTAPDGAAGDSAGQCVALSGALALVGMVGDSDLGVFSGSAYLFDATSGGLIAKLTAPDGVSGDQFGASVALNGGVALIGANGDDDQGSHAGAAYCFRPLATPLSLRRVAARGSAAPGGVSTVFRGFGSSVFINPEGEASLTATLSGAGASDGRGAGAWNTLATGQSLDAALRTQDPVGGGARILGVTGTLSNHPGQALIHTQLAGTGVTSANNRALWRDNGSMVSQVLRTGDTVGGVFLGGRLQNMIQVTHGPLDAIGVAAQLRRGTGTGAGEVLVTEANDSAVLFVNHGGTKVGTLFREGTGDGMGTLGQIGGRLALGTNEWHVFPAWWIPAGGGSALQRLYEQPYSSVSPFVQASQGWAASGTGGAAFRSFLGEAMSTDYAVWRATLSGAGVTVQNNEGLWHETPFGGGMQDTLIVRKGQEVEPGLKVARILQYWASFSNQRAMFLAKLSGAGVNASNDVALFGWYQNGGMPSLTRLMREGDDSGAADGSRIGVIQRVDVEQNHQGHYVVLASLTGPAAANQGLFTGRLDGGAVSSMRALRLPALTLRKGTLHAAAGTVPRLLRGLSLSVTTEASGAGGKGFGKVIDSSGRVILSAPFDNGAQEILSGAP